MAFNGDSIDFFDRIKRGGYATDKDYVSKLNRVLASIKTGGTVNRDVLKNENSQDVRLDHNDKPYDKSIKSSKLGGLIPSIYDLIK